VARLASLPAVLFALMHLWHPSAALADDIYKWTDEKGRSVLSNVPPTKNDRARDVKLLVKDARAGVARSTAVPGPVTPPADQASAKETGPATAPEASPKPVNPPAEQAAATGSTSEEEPPPRRSRRRRSSEPE
jgi:hypothetical protein